MGVTHFWAGKCMNMISSDHSLFRKSYNIRRTFEQFPGIEGHGLVSTDNRVGSDMHMYLKKYMASDLVISMIMKLRFSLALSTKL